MRYAASFVDQSRPVGSPRIYITGYIQGRTLGDMVKGWGETPTYPFRTKTAALRAVKFVQDAQIWVSQPEITSTR